MARIVLFLSTTRSGTQWLAAQLAAVYSDLAIVKHEPLHMEYRPNQFLRAFDRLDEMSRLPEVAAHLRKIASLAEEQLYIEIGWGNYAAVPLFLKTFPGRLQIVHLTRHPVHMALSGVTVNYYQFDQRDDRYV